MDGKQARQRAADFAVLLAGIEGALPLERAARKGLGLFHALRDARMTWPQITTLMSNAGVRRRDGMAVTSAQWRAMISRLSVHPTGHASPAIPTHPTFGPTVNPAPRDERSPSTPIEDKPTSRDSFDAQARAEIRARMARASSVRRDDA